MGAMDESFFESTVLRFGDSSLALGTTGSFGERRERNGDSQPKFNLFDINKRIAISFPV
jgi:hypothetical protein